MPSDPKRLRQKRKKRSFCGNRHTKRSRNELESALDCAESRPNDRETSVELLDSGDHEISKTLVRPKPTRTEQKLSELYSISDTDSDSDKENQDSDTDSEEEGTCTNLFDSQPEGFRFIDIEILNQNISDQLCCKYCKRKVTLCEVSRKGLGSEFAFLCSNKTCDKQTTFFSCPVQPNGNLPPIRTVNRRASFAMRCIGGGRAALQTFCGVMNMPAPVQKCTYNTINKTLQKATSVVQEKSMKKAAKAEYAMAEETEEPVRDIDVSVDGTYMTRGHTSNIGVTTAIGCVSGKVLDTGVLSKTCKSCEKWAKHDPKTDKYKEWQARHKLECTKTHEGSSGSMESKIAVDIFARSEEQYNLRYSRYIGDGDTNSFKSVSDAKPYGDLQVTKIECVGHVQKRMGTRLRNLKKGMKGSKLGDGKSIGGQGRLTDVEINKIQSYYGNAIRENKGDLEKMRRAVWAVYFHKRSQDDAPTHNFCDIKWCPYLKAEATNTVSTFEHKGHSLPVAVMDVVKPIFKDLASTDLLRRCLDGYTQNANESLNAIIWKYCPKHMNQGLTVVQIAVAIAVCVFNDGATSVKAMLEELQLVPGKFTCSFLQDKDALRILTAKRQDLKASKEYRRYLRLKRLGREEDLVEMEGHPYLAGAY